MRNLTMLVVACLAFGFADDGSGAADPRPGQTSNTASEALQLPEDFFPIMSWEPVPKDKDYFGQPGALANLAACGFNVAAFVRSEHLPACRRHNLKAILADQVAGKTWKNRTAEQIRDELTSLVGSTARDSIVLGYYIVDEPGAAQFPQLGLAVETVKRLAPGKLAYINLFPDYAVVGAPDISQLEAATYDEYLRKYLDTVRPQLVSYDNYRVQYSYDGKDVPTLAGYYRNLLQIRKAAFDRGLPFWNIVASSQILPQFPPPAPASLSLQAWTTLAAGAQGLTWYTYFSHGYACSPIDQAGHKSAQWNYLRMVNAEVATIGPILRRLVSTGVYFSAPLADQSFSPPMLPGEAIERITCDVPVMVGEFRSKDARHSGRFAVVVNTSLDRTVKLQLVPKASGKAGAVISPVTGLLAPLPPDQSLWLTAGSGALLSFP